jgi:hypothetical protein
MKKRKAEDKLEGGKPVTRKIQISAGAIDKETVPVGEGELLSHVSLSRLH